MYQETAGKEADQPGRGLKAHWPELRQGRAPGVSGPPGEVEAPGPRLALSEQVRDQLGAGSGLARWQGRRRAVVGGELDSQRLGVLILCEGHLGAIVCF